jgi:HlyD family secretion protein
VKKKSMFIVGILIVLLAAGGLGYRAWASSREASSSAVQTATIEQGSLSSTLSSSGNTRAGQSATIAWQTSGKVGEVTLKAGEVVEEDQVLAALDPNTLTTDMIEAKQDLITAQQTLDDLQNSKLQQAKALQAVEDAQKALDGLKQTAAEQSSQAQLALANAQEALDEAIKTRNAMNYPHSTDKLTIEKAETDYLLAKAVYKDALQEYTYYQKKKLTNPDRVRALNNLVSARQKMQTAFATYNWYLQSYTETEIAQADAAIAVAQANLETAQADWDSLKNGTSEAAIALAEATLADAQREWERVKDGASEQDLTAAQFAVDAAQASIDYAELKAPFAGTITQVDVATADLVSKGDAAFRIDDLSSIYVDLSISEVDLESVKVGQQATVEFDAIADKVYNAEVTEIGMIPTVSNGVVNYTVTIRITDVDEAIRPGMTASVTIVIDQVDNALLVPNKAIRTSNGQKTVIILFEGQQISVPVTVTLTGDSMSAVTSTQLKEGDTVVLSGTTASTTTTTTTSNQGPGGMPGDFGGGMPPAGMP